MLDEANLAKGIKMIGFWQNFGVAVSCFLFVSSQAKATTFDEVAQSLDGFLCFEEDTGDVATFLFGELNGKTVLISFASTFIGETQAKKRSRGTQ